MTSFHKTWKMSHAVDKILAVLFSFQAGTTKIFRTSDLIEPCTMDATTVWGLDYLAKFPCNFFCAYCFLTHSRFTLTVVRAGFWPVRDLFTCLYIRLSRSRHQSCVRFVLSPGRRTQHCWVLQCCVRFCTLFCCWELLH